jgi:hypothetical protein
VQLLAPQIRQTETFLDISVLFCPVHVEWTTAVKCLYRVVHRSLYTRRNILNIEAQVAFKSPCKMGHFREHEGTIIATAGFLFISPGTEFPCWSWHGTPPKLQIKQEVELFPLDHGCFLPNPLRFIIYQSTNHSTAGVATTQPVPRHWCFWPKLPVVYMHSTMAVNGVLKAETDVL